MPAADAGALREFGPETKLRVQVHRADDAAGEVDDAFGETWQWGNDVIFFIRMVSRTFSTAMPQLRFRGQP
jgi:hypothetical protein